MSWCEPVLSIHSIPAVLGIFSGVISFGLTDKSGCVVVTWGETGCATAVLPGEFVLLSEFAAEPELAVDTPRQNAKHFTLFCELAFNLMIT
jgi:hypothetical protein